MCAGLKFQGARSRKGKRSVKSAFQWGLRKILLMVPEGESHRHCMRFSTVSHISKAKTTLGGCVSTVGVCVGGGYLFFAPQMGKISAWQLLIGGKENGDSGVGKRIC